MRDGLIPAGDSGRLHPREDRRRFPSCTRPRSAPGAAAASARADRSPTPRRGKPPSIAASSAPPASSRAAGLPGPAERGSVSQTQPGMPFLRAASPGGLTGEAAPSPCANGKPTGVKSLEKPAGQPVFVTFAFARCGSMIGKLEKCTFPPKGARLMPPVPTPHAPVPARKFLNPRMLRAIIIYCNKIG